MWAIFLSLVAISLLFIWFNQALPAGLFFLAAIFYLLTRFLKGSGKAVKGTAKALTKGMHSEMEKADTTALDGSVLEAAAKNAADLAGQQLYAGSQTHKKAYLSGDNYQLKFKGMGAAGDSFQKLIDLFHKVFK